MEELLEQLKITRESEQLAINEVNRLRDLLENTEEYYNLQKAKEWLDVVKADLQIIDEQVRQQALDLYGLTGDKHPHDKVSIVINRTLHYQESEAFDWAGKNAPTMLKLDTKKFEKHARAVLETVPLAFVEVEEVPSVRIAGEL